MLKPLTGTLQSITANHSNLGGEVNCPERDDSCEFPGVTLLSIIFIFHLQGHLTGLDLYIAQCARFDSSLRRKGRNRRSREGLSMLEILLLSSSSYTEEILPNTLFSCVRDFDGNRYSIALIVKFWWYF